VPHIWSCDEQRKGFKIPHIKKRLSQATAFAQYRALSGSDGGTLGQRDHRIGAQRADRRSRAALLVRPLADRQVLADRGWESPTFQSKNQALQHGSCSKERAVQTLEQHEQKSVTGS